MPLASRRAEVVALTLMYLSGEIENFADVETASNNYARRFSSETGQWFLDQQANNIKKAVESYLPADAETQLQILDVGGGHAQVVEALNGVPQVALSVRASSESALEHLQSVSHSSVSHSLDYSVSIGNLLSTGLNSESFDVVTCLRLLPHCVAWTALIAEICRLSRTAVVVDYPPLASFNFLYPLFFWLKKVIEGDTRPFTVFTHKEIDRQFKLHGFHRIKRSGQFFFPMALHRALNCLGISKGLESLAAALGLRNLFGSPVLAVYERQNNKAFRPG